MTPKFRGDSDDWLNEEDEGEKTTRSNSNKNKAKIKINPLGCTPESANATVAEVFHKQCRIRLDDSSAEFLCSYLRAEVLSSPINGKRERSPVAVGDRVLVRVLGQDSGIIESIAPRRNALKREAPGQTGLTHVIAANIDALAILASPDEFSTSLEHTLIDRYLVAAQAESITPILCITKADLLPKDLSSASWHLYKELGIKVIAVSAERGDEVHALREQITGKTVVFCGRSGVGKTSLLKILLGRDVGKIGEINAATGKGRHTTSSAVLLGGPENSRWIDTPGVREFSLSGITQENLKNFFPEFTNHPCKRDNCHHDGEQDCAVRSLPRYPSYLRIFRSLEQPL